MPTAKESRQAEISGRVLADYVDSAKQMAAFQLVKGGKTKELVLPLSALKLLLAILEQMAEGNAVTLLPIHAELTTQEAADLLNVSRPHFVSLLEKGAIPFHKVGTRRRVYANDVLKYKLAIDEKRLQTLEELTKLAQDLDMGYE
ncbi:MAG: helix-turn-helix domain-containing protein [Legionellales bacterium]|nr:helix-turn-helix domain-containing protein [Legionellales bacterium]